MGYLLQIGVLGINHKTADLSFREEIARAAAALSGEKARFFPHPIILLSTCNRTEIYFGGEDLALVHSDLLNHLRHQTDIDFEHRLYSYFGIDCFFHLAKVTAGLDSAIIAETEIQRQVKLAYAKGCEFSSIPACMHYVFQKTLKLGKFIRTKYQLDRSAPTLYQAIWTLSQERLGDLQTKKIMLVGHSDTNRAMACFLSRRGIRNFSLCTQHPSSVNIPDCIAVDRNELDLWQSYDLIICAAGRSDDYVISGDRSPNTMIFDLCVPRIVDPILTAYNIEEIDSWVERKLAMHSDQVGVCNDLIWLEIHKLARSYRAKIQSKLFVTTHF